MSAPQKVLTVCQGGNVRSVMARYLLNYKYGLDCLACGWEPNTEETRNMLFEWADIIVPMQSEFVSKIPARYRQKVRLVLDVGPDRWGLNEDLLSVVDSLIQKTLTTSQKEAFMESVGPEEVGG